MSKAPTVTVEELQAAIKKTEFVILPDGRTTIALVTLDNGFTVRGESSCVCKENFDQALGEEYAARDAQSKIWPLLGFRLADRLHQQKLRKSRGARYRCAISGAYVTPAYAKLNPKTTVREQCRGARAAAAEHVPHAT